MNEPTLETVARRLNRLEREDRRLKRAGALALAVIAADLWCNREEKSYWEGP